VKANFFRKIWIILKTITPTLGISVYALYMRLTNTYVRPHADGILRWWSGVLLKATGATWEVSDPHGVTIEPGVPHIIMSNHRSHYDIPLIFVSLPGSIRMLTKKELFRVPVWGKGMTASEFLSIDRHNHEQALKDLEFAKEKMKSGIVLWIAPEGTRTRTGKLGDFKKGGFMVAIQTGARIIPVGIRDSDKILRAGTSDINLNQHVHIAIGAPIDAAAYGEENRVRLMEDVRKAIESLSA
jgi:1-acyl-sn-glycerol-3-phosphate acyltransferase